MAISKANGDTPYKTNENVESDLELARLNISKLKITLTDTPRSLPAPEALKFGMTFSDHMAVSTFTPGSGWSDPEIKPYGPITLDPCASCFQYSTNCFEGMKAYLGPDGKARLFRPELNVRRLERSVARLALPPIDGDTVLELIKRLVKIEKRWIPTIADHSLYLRPTIIGTRAALGVVPSDSAMLYIICSPSGPFFPDPRPIALAAVVENVRAWPGGTGGNKVGGNYSPCFVPQRIAEKQGYDQVLWLFGTEGRVTEAGAMNVFAVVKRDDGDGFDFITSPLDGTILPGVTRASCLELAADRAFQDSRSLRLHPAERTFTIYDLERWAAEGKLEEVLCVGTASIVVSVDKIGFEGREIRVLNHEAPFKSVGKALREKILDIQEGKDAFEGWSVLCE